jgi:hypothetical protein
MGKPCKTCGAAFTEAGFYRAGKRWMSECKECWKARVKARRLTDPAVRAYDRQRAKTPERVAKATATTKAWRERNPEAYKAHCALSNAVRDGKVKRKPCEVCASTTGIHAHHKDYARPLEVVWLCARCHHRLHALFPELEGSHKRAA